MLEKQFAQEFHRLFEKYPIYVMVNKTMGGWPDRMIQLPNSTVCFVELKVVDMLDRNTIVHAKEFQQDQAAFMAKWQRSGGLCFLFMALLDHDNIKHYGVIAPDNWRVWTQIPRRYLRPGELQIYTYNIEDVLYWFMDWSEEMDRSREN